MYNIWDGIIPCVIFVESLEKGDLVQVGNTISDA
jgi:hypothetical protein